MSSGGSGEGRKPWLGREIFGQPPRAPNPLPQPPQNDRSEYAARAVEELRAAATLMSESQRIANFGSWEWRVREHTVVWSDQLYRIFGLDRATFKATVDAYVAHTHPDERDEVRRRIQDAVEGQRKFRFEHRILRPDGQERALRCHGEPVLDAAGGVERVIGVCQDITEFAVVESQRDEADARFRSAFEHAPIGIALVDFPEGPEGRLTQVNRALCELTGRSERELVGSTLVALALAEDADLDRALRERVVDREISR
jgi:PAS domain S-box-containing protein